jgi:catechol 2,3-dioxygenase-like lactoylglutathione lyase family enzyme
MSSRLWTPVVAVALTIAATPTLTATALDPPVAEDVPGPGTTVLEGRLLVQLQVRDLDRSIAFYTRTLGCRVTERRDDLEFAHVDCGLPGLQLGLSAGGENPPVPGSVVLNFGVKGDIEKARKRLESQGVVFTGPTRIIAGKVRLAGFRDPDGYALRLAAPDTSPD